jgi:hypothetical protein
MRDRRVVPRCDSCGGEPAYRVWGLLPGGVSTLVGWKCDEHLTNDDVSTRIERDGPGLPTMRFRDLDPHSLLFQECTNDYCRHRTLHGFPSQLKWIWSVPMTSVRPVCGCDNCGEPFRGEFQVEIVELNSVSNTIP